MVRKSHLVVVSAICVALTGGLLIWAQEKKETVEQERTVKEAEVPAAALAALKKLAGSATITEFAEEIEHGHKFYEGSWKGPDGNVDALVTEAGDVVEIEEIIPADKAPASVRAEAQKAAGKDAQLTFERKTVFLYEVHFKEGEKRREMIFTADGRSHHEEGPDKGQRSEGAADGDE